MSITCEPVSGFGFRQDYLLLSSTIIGFLVIFYVFYMRKHRNYSRNKKNNADFDAVLESFHPEPLVGGTTDDENLIVQPNIVSKKIGTKIAVNDKEYLNFVSHNHLNLIGNKKITDEAISTIQKYGVGSCGPRGFYGTVDVHLDLEQRISDFMNMEEAAVYSYWFSTIASAIPAYCKRNDVIFCDEMISFAAQKGMDAAKCKVYFFKHNDPKDLEDKIISYEKKIGSKKPLARKFLVLEGIYHNTGNMCDLVPMIDIRRRYKIRLFLDESLSIGVLGATGRGIMEHLNIPSAEVDMVMGSLENIVGSIGGFCVGSHFIIEHQRLSGLGYCFSASLPPVLTRAAYCAFDYLDENPQIIEKLRNTCSEFHSTLKTIPNIRVYGHEFSPVKYLILLRNNELVNMPEFYEKFVENCKKEGIVVGLIRNTTNDQWQIKLCMNVDFTPDNLEYAKKTLSKIAVEIFQR